MLSRISVESIHPAIRAAVHIKLFVVNSRSVVALHAAAWALRNTARRSSVVARSKCPRLVVSRLDIKDAIAVTGGLTEKMLPLIDAPKLSALARPARKTRVAGNSRFRRQKPYPQLRLRIERRSALMVCCHRRRNTGGFSTAGR